MAETPSTTFQDIIELLTERRKFRYAGDCKCGKCCLVPHEMLCSAIDEIKRMQRALEIIAHGEPDYSVFAYRYYQAIALTALRRAGEA